MKSEVVDWLAEIRAMKEKTAQAQKERDEAKESSAHWRKLYSTEAQQRRIDAKLAQEKIEQLQAEIQQLQPSANSSQEISVEENTALEKEVNQLQSPQEIKQKLIRVMKERDRLFNALKTERQNHARTRKSLTTVIGDTMERLSKKTKAIENNE